MSPKPVSYISFQIYNMLNLKLVVICRCIFIIYAIADTFQIKPLNAAITWNTLKCVIIKVLGTNRQIKHDDSWYMLEDKNLIKWKN